MLDEEAKKRTRRKNKGAFPCVYVGVWAVFDAFGVISPSEEPRDRRSWASDGKDPMVGFFFPGLVKYCRTDRFAVFGP